MLRRNREMKLLRSVSVKVYNLCFDKVAFHRIEGELGAWIGLVLV